MMIITAAKTTSAKRKIETSSFYWKTFQHHLTIYIDIRRSRYHNTVDIKLWKHFFSTSTFLIYYTIFILDEISYTENALQSSETQTYSINNDIEKSSTYIYLRSWHQRMCSTFFIQELPLFKVIINKIQVSQTKKLEHWPPFLNQSAI